jgi:hypothetical protein
MLQQHALYQGTTSQLPEKFPWEGFVTRARLQPGRLGPIKWVGLQPLPRFAGTEFDFFSKLFNRAAAAPNKTFGLHRLRKNS